MSERSLPLGSGTVEIDPSEIATFQARHPLRERDGALWWRIGLILEVALILGLWQYLIGSLELVRPAFLPPPSTIATSFVDLVTSPTFLDDLVFSLSNLVVGVLLASAVGVSVGLAVGWFRLLEVTVEPLIWIMYSIPKVALAPLIILALGLGSASKVLIVFLLGVFPVALNTMEGVRTVDPSLIRAARVFGSRGPGLAKKVILPATLPFVLVGLRRAVALGFVGEILGEFIGATKGIGHALQEATVNFRMDDALAIVVVIVIFSNIGLLILDIIRRRVAPWYEEGPSQPR
jgi:ABC-type nitrate/sulfonate/bicarbonate transport system permease component